jgi:hypothetical protein
LSWVFKLPADFKALKVPEGPSDTGPFFWFFSLGKRKKTNSKKLVLAEPYFSDLAHKDQVLTDRVKKIAGVDSPAFSRDTRAFKIYLLCETKESVRVH